MATPTHAERLANAKLAIDNALNTPKIKEALADYGKDQLTQCFTR